MTILRKAREAARLGQGDVARFLRIGVNTLWRYENGTTSPNADILSKMADLYGCSADALIGRSPLPQQATDAPPPAA